MSTINKINNIEERIRKTLDELRGIRSMIRGSYGKIYRQCGKPNCWCANSKTGHPLHRITWFKDAQSGTKAIPKDDVTWIKEMTETYREFRQLRTKLRLEMTKLKKALDQLEDEVILKTKKIKDYL